MIGTENSESTAMISMMRQAISFLVILVATGGDDSPAVPGDVLLSSEEKTSLSVARLESICTDLSEWEEPGEGMSGKDDQEYSSSSSKVDRVEPVTQLDVLDSPRELRDHVLTPLLSVGCCDIVTATQTKRLTSSKLQGYPKQLTACLWRLSIYFMAEPRPFSRGRFSARQLCNLLSLCRVYVHWHTRSGGNLFNTCTK